MKILISIVLFLLYILFTILDEFQKYKRVGGE